MLQEQLHHLHAGVEGGEHQHRRTRLVAPVRVGAAFEVLRGSAETSFHLTDE
jgi:hypothetical protein